MNPRLINYIKRYIDITSEEAELFENYLNKRSIKKKEYLLKEGQFCKTRYFIISGSLRLFYIDTKGNEQIVHFAVDNWWMTDYDSLINKSPSRLYIQAIENTELLELQEHKFEDLCTKLPKVDKLFRIIMEKTYIAIQKRMEYMFSLSGEELYHVFINNNPEFAQRIPQYMLASYLGFTPEFLSKIRAKK